MLLKMFHIEGYVLFCWDIPIFVVIQLEGHNEEQFAAVRHLCSDLRSLLGSSLFSDVEISTRGGTVISSHAVLLAARCPSLRVVSIVTQERNSRDLQVPPPKHT